MKKQLKIIKNKTGKFILGLLIKKNRLNFFPKYVQFFPVFTYKVSHDLLKRGYLNLAYEIIKSYTPNNEKEKNLKERIISMSEIKQNGLSIKKKPLQKIDNINILFAVHNSLPYDNAGYAIRTHSIVTQLSKKNIPLVVATRPGYPWDIQKHRSLPYKDNDVIDGIKYIRLNDKNHIFKQGADKRYIDTYTKELVKLAKIQNSTIIHGSSNYLNAHASIKAGNILSLPSIYEIRGLWHLTRLTIDKSYRYNGMFEYDEKMVQIAAKSATKVVVISEALKKLLISWNIESNKISVIPNAVDISLFNPKPPCKRLVDRYNLHSRFTIGFIGSLTSYEGLDYLIKVINNLSKEHNISLLIVGDGKEKEKLQNIAKTKHIIFTGRVPFTEVEDYYSIFDICVYPRTDEEVCKYIPPLKPLEAMAMKKAVIVSNVPPLLEIVKNRKRGLVCESNNLESLKKSILKLYNNKKFLNKIANNGYNWVKENRSWEYISNKYIELYKGFIL